MNKRWMAAIGVAVLALAGCGGGAELPDGQYDLGNGISVAVRDVVVDDQQVAANLEYFTTPTPSSTTPSPTMHSCSPPAAWKSTQGYDELESVPKAVPPQSSGSLEGLSNQRRTGDGLR